MKLRRRRRRRRTEIVCSVFIQARPQPRFRSAPPPSLISLSSSTPSHQSTSSVAQLVSRHGSGEQYSPAIPPQLFRFSPFFIKLPKRKSVADVVPSQPVQLSRPTIACGRPARRTLAPPGGPLVLHRFRFLLSLGAVHPHRAKP